MTTFANFHQIQRLPSQIKAGDVVVHLDGEPARVTETRIQKDEIGFYYGFSFEGDRVPYAQRPNDFFTVLIPFPKVGDLATLCYPSDRYPYIVTSVSPSGRIIKLLPLQYRIVSGSFQTGNAVVEYEFEEDSIHYGEIVANWGSKRGYTRGGTPISIGSARYYQAPEV